MAKRQYDNDYVSVTEALAVLRKIGLEMWFKYNTAKFCKEASDKGKEIGTTVHSLIEKHINEEELKIDTVYPEEVTNALKSFFLFKKENPNIKLKISEFAGTSEQYKYNFTTDCQATVDGKDEIIADWKTGEAKKEEKPKIYDESLYQASAYVKGFNEVKKSNIKGACVVSFAKDKIAYNIVWLDEKKIEKYFNRAFLPALTIAQLQREEKQEKKK